MCSHPSSGSTTETRPRSSEGRPERIPARAAFLFGARCNLPSGRPAWYGTGWYHGRGRTRVRTRVARRPRGCGVRVPPLSSAWRLAPGAWRKRNEPALQSARGRSRCGAGTRPGMTGRAPVWRGVAARAAPLPAVGSLSPSPPVLVEGSAPMCGGRRGPLRGCGE
jgi:hypothetical protein